MKHLVTMRHAVEDPDLFGNILPGDSWHGWRTLLIAMMGEALTVSERETFQRLTGREREPLERVEEFWGVIGRRGGKSRAISVLAAYIGALCDHSDTLVIGERGMIPILAATKEQASVIFSYITALFASVPALAEMRDGEPTSDTLALHNQIEIRVQAASFRTVRSITAVAAIGDEAAFWRNDYSANPDVEILNALRPARKVTGDHYAGEWPRERFRTGGVEYEPSDKSASTIYSELLPLINGERAQLLEHKRLHAQLVALERRTSRTGKDLISHPPGGHDDIANAAAGAIVYCRKSSGRIVIPEDLIPRLRAMGMHRQSQMSSLHRRVR